MIVLGGLFALLVWLPWSTCLQIVVANTTTQGADTNVTLIHEPGDPGQLFLKKYQLDAGEFAQPVFPVDSFNANTSTFIVFFFPMRYQVVAVDNTNNPTLENALARSNVIQVGKNSTFSGKDNNDGGGGGGSGGGNKGNNNGHHQKDDDHSGTTSLATSGNNTGTIIGIVFGVLTFLSIVGILGYVSIRRRRRRAFRPQRMVRDSYSPSSFRQYMTEKYMGSPPMTVHTPSIISADPYGYLKRPSPPPPTYPSIYDTHTAADTIRRSIIAPSTITSLNVSPFTDRQMQIHQRLYELQQELLRLEKKGNLSAADTLGTVNDEVEVMYAKTKIGTLRDFLDSPWAKHQTDELPPELKLCF
ncbi:hypothetical protein BDZ89DRAFT_1131296 [Hymenopellis radicata]|nr:hypothetical protein BDZ89DRAFT_1131296 [Hymenopellis radicata]